MKEEFEKAMEKERATHANQMEDWQKRYAKLERQNYDLTVSNSFKSSRILNGEDSEIIAPLDMIEEKWGKNFKTEEVNGRMVTVGYYDDGRPIYSDNKPGEFATFDEAIKKLIDTYPNKDRITRGKQQTGGGTNVGDSSNGVKQVTRDLGSYTHLSDFRSEAEKQAYIDKYGFEKYREILRNSRGANVPGKITDMGGMNK